MIAPPVQDTSRAVWRAVLEAGAQFIPVTAALTRILQTTHPSKFDQEIAQWRFTVSASANDLEARLQHIEQTYRPRLTLSSEAVALALWLAKRSDDGRDHSVDFEEIMAGFPNMARSPLQEAAAELKLFGLAAIDAVVGNPVPGVAPTFGLFALFDPVARGTSPQVDAVAFAREALDLGVGNVAEIAQRLEWAPRRVNPALALLLPLLSSRSREIHPDYVCPWFRLDPDERVRLRRLVADANSLACP